MILVGNKNDIPDRKVTVEEGKVWATDQELANKYNMTFLETSAKTSENVTSAFLTLVKQIKSKISIAPTKGNTTKLNPSEKIKKGKGCC